MGYKDNKTHFLFMRLSSVRWIASNTNGSHELDMREVLLNDVSGCLGIEREDTL